ncbi:hypothetical protein ACQ4WX_17140 [Streptomyces lasalocidi]
MLADGSAEACGAAPVPGAAPEVSLAEASGVAEPPPSAAVSDVAGLPPENGAKGASVPSSAMLSPAGRYDEPRGYQDRTATPSGGGRRPCGHADWRRNRPGSRSRRPAPCAGRPGRRPGTRRART